MSRWSSEFQGALIGGFVASIGLFGAVILVGSVGNFEALRLIEATLPTARFLASATLGAGITVLALMLTLIGITTTSDLNFADVHYRRIRLVNVGAIAVIVVSVVVLIAMAIPIGEVDEVRGYYPVLYYMLAGLISLLGGLVVALALMIGGTVSGLADAAHPEGRSHLIVDTGENDTVET